MYYDIDAIFSEASEKNMKEGKSLYYDNAIGNIIGVAIGQKQKFSCDICTKTVSTDKPDASGNVKPDGHNDADGVHNVSVLFDEQGGLYEYSCDCGGFESLSGPCAHIVAAALALSETVQTAPVGTQNKGKLTRNTDLAATAIIKEYTKKRNTRFMRDADCVELEPIFCLRDNEMPYLRLKVGRNRKYTIKNISDFLSAVTSEWTVRYGTSLKFKHNESSFAADAQRLIDFLLKCRKDRMELGVRTQFGKDEFPLTFGERDEFFEMYLNKSVIFCENNFILGSRRLVENNELRPELYVDCAEDGYFVGFPWQIQENESENTAEQKLHAFLEGRSFCYYITDETITRCSYRLWQNASSLINAAKAGKLFVSASDMPVFYNNVLSRAHEVLDINSGRLDLSIFSSPPLRAELYLDKGKEHDCASGEYGEIEATLKCRYGDLEINIIAGDVGAPVYRDWETENRLKATLAEYFPYYPKLFLSEDGDIYHLYKEGLGQLYNYLDIFISESLSPIKIKKNPRTQVGIRLSSGLLELDFSDAEFSEKELNELVSAYNSGKKYIKMGDGSFVDITDESVGALSGILSLGTRRGKTLSLPAYYAQIVDEHIREGFLIAESDSQFKKFIEDFESYQNLEMNFGALEKTLRSYQKEGARWLKMMKNYGFGGILADDMGLGKTLQTLSFISEHSKGVSIVICPTSLIINWEKEAASFTPQLKTLPIMGNAKERADLIASISMRGNGYTNSGEKKSEASSEADENKNSLNGFCGNAEGYDIVITSYELFKRDSHLYEGLSFEIAVLDEAQYIKNHETQNARAVKRLTAKHRFALTGTPIENSLSELWSIFDFLMPGYLYSYGKFRSRFEAGIVKGNVETIESLKKMVQPFILRRLKSAVLTELPPKMESEITIPLCDEQKEIYQKHLALIKSSIDSGQAKDKITVLSMLTRLRQICCDPSLVDAAYSGNSEKLETCINLLKNIAAAGRKALMFSQYTSMLDIIAKKLTEEGIRYFVLEGSTPKGERNRLVERFNSDDTSVFLISLRAGGTGINLTGADTVIHYDPWWNDPVMNQATDRAHRIGQRKSVNVYKLITKDSIEEKIVSLRQKKSALAGMFVADESALSISDLISLLV